MSKATVEFGGCSCVSETSKAILVKGPEWEKPFWIPKSQIDDDSEVYKINTEGKLIITEWLATEKGLV